jgi:hypothetical protein
LASPRAETESDRPFGLELAERDAVAGAATAFARVLPQSERREQYTRIAEAASLGLIPADLVPALEAMLDVLLQPERAAREGGPATEQVLLGVFRRTPRGASLAAAAHEVNQALRMLRGQTLASLRVESRPGQHSLNLETDRCRVVLRLDSAGARVESLEVG